MLTEMHPSSLVNRNAALAGGPDAQRSLVKGRDTFYVSKGSAIMNQANATGFTAG
jgi:hypothetical protein